MSLRTNALLFLAAGALLTACSGQPAATERAAATATDMASAPASEMTVAVDSEQPDDAAAMNYPLTEVAQHATAEDCWTAVDGKVYDLTEFIAKHPGGEDKIIGMCGKDATADFNAKHGSDDDPKAKLMTYEIGELAS